MIDQSILFIGGIASDGFVDNVIALVIFSKGNTVKAVPLDAEIALLKKFNPSMQ